MQHNKENMNRLSLIDGSMEQRNTNVFPVTISEQQTDIMAGAIVRIEERLTLDGVEQSERIVLPALFVHGKNTEVASTEHMI